MNTFPSIEQFRHVIRAERDQAAFDNREPAKRVYRGTVKLHGTNAGVHWAYGSSSLEFLSRTRTIKVGDDNAGFAAHFSDPVHSMALMSVMVDIIDANNLSDNCNITIFGEWCGQGIQKGVAVSQLPKMFVVFAARVGCDWLENITFEPNHQSRIFPITMFTTFYKEIDFSRPELVQNELVDLTMEVERECPVGMHFGVSGIGEGIVWTPVNGDRRAKYWFKVKGEKHSVSKVAKLAAVDVEAIRAKDELVAKLCTPARLEQALDHHINEAKLSLEMRDISHFLRWVINDIAKEETDTIEASGFTIKDLGKPISDIAKRVYLKAIDESVGLAA